MKSLINENESLILKAIMDDKQILSINKVITTVKPNTMEEPHMNHI